MNWELVETESLLNSFGWEEFVCTFTGKSKKGSTVNELQKELPFEEISKIDYVINNTGSVIAVTITDHGSGYYSVVQQTDIDDNIRNYDRAMKVVGK